MESPTGHTMKYFMVAAPIIIVLLLCASLGLFVELQHEKQVNAMLWNRISAMKTSVEAWIDLPEGCHTVTVHQDAIYDCEDCMLDTPHNNESPTDPTPSGRKQ
jgi:hypothetical protein